MSSSTSLFRRISTPRRRAAVGLTLACFVLGAPIAYHFSAGIGQAAVSARRVPLGLRFEPGSTLRYRATWSGQQRGRLFSGDAPGTETHTNSVTDMALDMSLFVEAVKDGEATLVLSFSDIARHRLELIGGEVFPSRAHADSALTGFQARIRVGSDGVSRDVAFEQGTPDVFMNVVQWVVAQSTVSLGPSTEKLEWEAAERGPFGTSRVRYEHQHEELLRTRTMYTSFDAFAKTDEKALRVSALKGSSTIRIRQGLLESVRTEERVRVDGPDGAAELDGRVRFELRLLRVDRAAAAPRAAAYAAVEPAGEPIVGPDTLSKLIEQRVDGLTREELLSDLALIGNGGVMPAHTRWLWRATGLLKQDPALAAELVKVALASGATDKARALVMDLLASVGHPEAQAAMRALLASPALARSPARPALLQRVSFLEAPAAETIATAWDAYREGKQKGWNDLAYASAHALAATSRAAAERGDAVTARDIVGRLGSEIASASTEEERATLLGALANASSAEVAAIAKPYAESEDVATREASANALRKVDTREATDLLLGLFGDSALDVQSMALASLGDRTLTEADWGRIASLLRGGRVNGGLDGALLNLAAPFVGSVPEVRDVVLYIALRPQASAATRARAQAMLARAG